MSSSRKIFTPIWLALWAFLLGLGWLLPNHYYPWIAFHTDAWVAGFLAIAAAVVLGRGGQQIAWHSGAILIAGFATIPFIQYASGLLPFIGQAWTGTAYMLGLLLALLIGARWESAHPTQAADGLFTAIGVAALVSVGLQLQQWLRVEGLDDWTIGMAGSRPFANLGQPNQLATLLLWGLLACAWGVVRRQIGVFVAVLMVVYLLIGIVLTQSRTAWISLVIGVALAWIWKSFWRVKAVPWIVTGLGLFFCCGVASLNLLSEKLYLGFELRPMETASGQIRLDAYRLFIDALLQRPVFGFGWYQLAEAQLSVSEAHANLFGFFLHSHNLFLDICLWCGIPIGMLALMFVIVWSFRSVIRIRSAENALLLMFLLVVGIHAMLELPLHYAYFLLPTGLVVGILNVRLNHRVVGCTGRLFPSTIWLCSVVLLCAIVRDYMRVEANFQAFRFEAARVGTLPKGKEPDVLVLTHLREFIRLARFEVDPKLHRGDINWMKSVTYVFPSPANLFSVAKALALTGRVEEAQQWLRRMRLAMAEAQYADLKSVWRAQSEEYPSMAKVAWPGDKSIEQNSQSSK